MTAWWSVRAAMLAFIFHAARLAGRVSSATSPNRRAMLVLRTDGIGDAVLFEPALRSLADRFADYQLHLWAPAATCELFGQHPSVSRTLAVPRGGKAGNLEYFASARWRAVMGWRLGRHVFSVAAYAVESPEPLGDWLLSSVRARQRWYSPGDTENQFAWQRGGRLAANDRRSNQRRHRAGARCGGVERSHSRAPPRRASRALFPLAGAHRQHRPFAPDALQRVAA